MKRSFRSRICPQTEEYGSHEPYPFPFFGVTRKLGFGAGDRFGYPFKDCAGVRRATPASSSTQSTYPFETLKPEAVSEAVCLACCLAFWVKFVFAPSILGRKDYYASPLTTQSATPPKKTTTRSLLTKAWWASSPTPSAPQETCSLGLAALLF